MNLPLYNQGDPRWSSVDIGMGVDGPITIGRFGCLLTCESMRLNAYGYDETPDTLVRKAKLKGGVLDPEGNIYWDGMERLFNNLALLERRYTVNRPGEKTPDGSPKVTAEASIERVKLMLSMGQPVPLEIMIPSQHFVLAVLWDEGRRDFLVHNPDGGVKHWFKDRYGDATTRLWGWILSVGPTAWFPENSTPERAQMGLSLGYAQLTARGKETQANALRAAESLLR